ERVIHRLADEAQIDRRHTEIGEGAKITNNVRRSAREETPLAVVGDGRNLRPVALNAIGDGNLGGVAARLGNEPSHALDPGAHARQRMERMLRICADGVPAITEPCHTTKRRGTLAADPEWRMRLLRRLWRHDNVTEAHVTSLELGCVLGPKLAERCQIFVG